MLINHSTRICPCKEQGIFETGNVGFSQSTKDQIGSGMCEPSNKVATCFHRMLLDTYPLSQSTRGYMYSDQSLQVRYSSVQTLLRPHLTEGSSVPGKDIDE
jgi:hypothetical protein